MTRKEENKLWSEYQEEMDLLENDEMSFSEWMRARVNREQIGISGMWDDESYTT